MEQRIIDDMPPMAALPEASKRLWMTSAREAAERGLERWAGKEAPGEQDPGMYVALAEDAVRNGLSPDDILRALETGCSVLIAGYWSLARTGDYSDLAAYTAWKHDQTELSLKVLRSAYHEAVRQEGRGEVARRAFVESLLSGEPCPDLAEAAGTLRTEAYLIVVLPTVAVHKALFPAEALVHALDGTRTAVFLPCEDTLEGWAESEAVAARMAAAGDGVHAVALARATSPGEVAGALAQAERSVALGSTLRLSGVVRPETLRVERLLQQDAELRADLLATLAPLAEQADLVTTLEQLYRADLDRGRCASRLGIHRRTLAYRLEKVAALTGIDPLSGPGIKTFQLALAALTLDTCAHPREDAGVVAQDGATRLSVVKSRTA